MSRTYRRGRVFADHPVNDVTARKRSLPDGSVPLSLACCYGDYHQEKQVRKYVRYAHAGFKLVNKTS